MPAVIQSTLYETPGGPVIGGSTQQNSRDDLRLGYQVALTSFHVATTYSWTLAFASESPGSSIPGTPFDGTPSSSALSATTTRSTTFNVDFEGTYLIRLVVDAGLPSEDTQFIRARALTLFGALKLVAAGERRDESGVIPVDASAEGWANDQNANLQRIALLIRRYAVSGRVLFVDANRGRDNSADQNDYDNLIYLPGTETARSEETGLRIRAMAHGDFTSINDAIAYAVAATSRDEPAPSKTNPYYIWVRPGVYIEDLNLASFVHVVGEWPTSSTPNGEQQKSVLIRTLNTGGTGTHTFNPQQPGSTHECFLANVHLENTANTTNPVLLHQGGLLYLQSCVVAQKGNAANQGPAIHSVTATGSYAPILHLKDSQVLTEATNATRVALLFNATSSELQVTGSTVIASSCYAVNVNPTLYENSECVFRQSTFEGLRPFEGYPSNLNAVYCRFLASGNPATNPALNVSPPSGVGSKAGVVHVSLDHVTLNGKIQFLTANAVGATSLTQSSVTQLGVAAGQQGLVLPDAPGDVPSLSTGLNADSVRYVKGFKEPLDGPGATSTINIANQVSVEDVQRILDLLWQGTFPATGSPFFSLETAYNGLATISPHTPGVGLGRAIDALGGAVQITGASYPQGMGSPLKHGGLQVEGVIEAGGFVHGNDPLYEIGGSDIHINANLTGGGPFIALGVSTWANGVVEPDRGFGGASVVASGFQAPSGSEAYHLHLRTANLRTPNTGKTGNIYVVAGATAGTNDAGEVHLVGGSHRVAGNTVGNLWLAPGSTTTPSTGVVWFVGAPDPGNGAVRCTLEPANTFVTGTSGTLVLGTPAGLESFTFTGSEANAAAAAAVINASAKGIFAANVGGKVVLYSEFGPSGDILYVGDSEDGDLNTALGNYILGSGATFTPGTYGNKVSVDVPSNGRFRVNGDLEYTGSLIPAPGGGGGFGDYVAIDSASSPYTPDPGEGIFACNTSAGSVTLNLTSGDAAGTVFIVTHLSGANSVTINATGGETIAGASSYTLIGTSGGAVASPGETVCLLRDGGSNWVIWSHYVPNPSQVRFVTADQTWLGVHSHNTYSVTLTPGTDITITLDSSMAIGQTITIKDEAGIANAIPSPGGQKIEIVDGVGGLFDGAGTLDITVGYGAVTLYKTRTGNWAII